MKTKNTMPLTEARRNIFSLADAVQKPDTHYILTDRGVPKMVAISVKKFEQLMNGGEKFQLADGNSRKYGFQGNQFFSKTLIIRDESRVIYLSGNDQNQNSRYQEEGLIKSQLFVKLIEEYSYPLGIIELGRYVKVGGENSRKYIEADIIINDERGNVDTIFEVGLFSEYEKNADKIISDLFDLASALSWVKKPKNLIYFSRSCKNGNAQEKATVIDYSKFNSFLAWKKAGRPNTKEIPHYDTKN